MMTMTVKWLGEEGKEGTWHGMSEIDGGKEVVCFERTVVSVWHGVLETQQGEESKYIGGQ